MRLNMRSEVILEAFLTILPPSTRKMPRVKDAVMS
jgi:hypothetical protein